ncbi:carbon-nitrogen hydrolase family protein [Alteromonas sp. a30]|uniref:carbon-nitrogen hydrolase family protein n=1 Tax=Alteromonas sp. a30 TaxID=2730917 RepID=UPI00227EE25E|nr:carbon-nitrogen hydrolase family protein [Alteromonas sp. a30]MCY7297087.1 carbon-nitrogen hydrolase family protein [Alteromonas sp. a30]
MTKTKVGALQIGSAIASKQATVSKILSYEQHIADANCEVIVMPEALLGGYPKGQDFGTKVGFRTDSGREDFLAYWEQAVDLDGPELKQMCQLAKRTHTQFVIGIIERRHSSLYCATVFISPEGELTNIHRKLMPTASERLIWAQGDGSTLPVVATKTLKLGSAICWENYMPLLRTTMYAKGVNTWCISTVDDRDIWQASMRHIAYEGRMFLISACQFLEAPQNLGLEADWPQDKPLIRGGSVIVSPMGEVLAGPLYGEEGLICAEIDLDDIVKARYDFDVSGHYARPDVFQLHVDESEKRPLSQKKEP